jgi:hypothetical protein
MVFYSRKPKKKKAKVMNSFYHIENSKLSENFENIVNFLNTKALSEPLHEVEQELFRYLLTMGKTFLQEFIKQKGTGKNSD